jgi:hypothetical protein
MVPSRCLASGALDEDEDELERGLGDSEVDVDVAEFGGLGAEEVGEIGGSARWGDEPTFS